MTRKVLNELKNAKILFLTKNKIPPSLVLIWKNAQLSLIIITLRQQFSLRENIRIGLYAR